MGDVIGSIGIVWVLFLILLVILWTLLPFAVFGIKERLDAQTQLLRDIKNELKTQNLANKKEDVTPTPKVIEHGNSIQSESDSQITMKELYSDPAMDWFKKDKS